MSDPAASSGDPFWNSEEKPAITCAVCQRRYQTMRTPGMLTIYSICPDCRFESTGAFDEDET